MVEWREPCSLRSQQVADWLDISNIKVLLRYFCAQVHCREVDVQQAAREMPPRQSQNRKSPLPGAKRAAIRNPITGAFGCCARAAGGHAAAPPSSAMKSRRLLSNMELPAPWGDRKGWAPNGSSLRPA